MENFSHWELNLVRPGGPICSPVMAVEIKTIQGSRPRDGRRSALGYWHSGGICLEGMIRVYVNRKKPRYRTLRVSVAVISKVTVEQDWQLRCSDPILKSFPPLSLDNLHPRNRRVRMVMQAAARTESYWNGYAYFKC